MPPADAVVTITTRHPGSRHGVPAVLVDGEPVADHAGVAAALRVLGWTRQRLADEAGYSLRTVEGWLSSGKTVPANALNVLRDALDGPG